MDPSFPDRLRRIAGRVDLRQGLLFVAAGALLWLGLALWVDRRGLVAEYFANSRDWTGSPVSRGLASAPGLSPGEARSHVRVRAFSVKWKGWIRIERAGRYRFATRSRSPSYVSLAGRLVVDNPGGPRADRAKGKIRLEPGLQPIEIGYSHIEGRHEVVEVSFKPAGGRFAPLDSSLLFPGRAGPLGRALRGATAPLSVIQRRALASLLFLSGLLVLPWALRPRREALGRLWQGLEQAMAERRRWVHAGFLLLVFLAAFFGSLPFTGSPYGFDDIRYMEAAVNTKPVGWFANRFVHVYLLKAFVELRGDPFRASELYWSFMFAVTAFAMAAGVMALGPGLQVPTLTVSFLLLFSQPMLFERIGAAYSDYTAMMFVTVGMAVYLHLVRRSGSSAGTYHALAIGLCTVWALKSKELGAVLLWLLPLLAFDGEHLHLKRFGKRLLFWLGGAAAALVVVAALDAAFLGDPLFGLRPGVQRSVGSFNFSAQPEEERGASGWMQIIWQGHPRRNPGDASAGLLGLLVLAAALAATGRRKRIELRLLHLMPVAYFVMLMLIQMRATYVHAPRYLYPILPVSCVLAAALFRYLGPGTPGWKEIASPRLFVPIYILAVGLLGFVLPLLAGRTWAFELLPLAWLERIGWGNPVDLLKSILIPSLTLVALSGLVLLFHASRARVVLLAAAVTLVLAPYLQVNVHRLANRFAVQRAENLLYPYRAFEDELRSYSGKKILLSRDLVGYYGMSGPTATRARIARLFLGRPVRLEVGRSWDPESGWALGTRRDLDRWVEPGSAIHVTTDPAGIVVLARPASPEVNLREEPEQGSPRADPDSGA